jgi:uncharacterized protein (DUF1501 family)
VLWPPGRLAAWPGVTDRNLYERRDLKPTIDLRSVLKGVLRDHLRIDERRLAAEIFPGSLCVLSKGSFETGGDNSGGKASA